MILLSNSFDSDFFSKYVCYVGLLLPEEFIKRKSSLDSSFSILNKELDFTKKVNFNDMGSNCFQIPDIYVRSSFRLSCYITSGNMFSQN